MRHKKGIKKLSRPTDQRMAMLTALAAALLIHDKIKTTLMRAKATQRLAEKIITLAKKGDLSARRLAASRLPHHPEVVKHIFDTAPQRFGSRAGGYTRITKTGFRRGDNAPMAVLELI